MEQIQTITFSDKQHTPASKCYHCGDFCPDSSNRINDKIFCCRGCRLVYELLSEHDLCDYYSLSQTPGNSPQEAGHAKRYDFLDDAETRRRLVDFSDGKTSRITLHIPAMHCSSCIWLLESLYKLNDHILSSRVEFLKKELTIDYKESPQALRDIVSLLANIGYEPHLTRESLNKTGKPAGNRDLYMRIGVAGFAFANIMLFSFPEYLSFRDQVTQSLQNAFRFLSLLLALPVLFYSSSVYFRSAWHSWKQRRINMDVPISLGIISLFGRSVYEIFSATGSGYLDSFAGLVFLLLIGKLFEKKTYDSLSFERDYKSYFPIAVTRKSENGLQTVPLERVARGDRLIIRSQEIVPADAILIRGQALIDYSFVTGEAVPVEKRSGDTIYAGGRQVGGTIELDVIKEVNQSYLTRLWNDVSYGKEQDSRITLAANTVSKYFTIIVLAIALAAGLYWAGTDFSLAFNAFTAVLIVACPCALALSTPFTLGNTLRIFGRNRFYLKNTAVVERLAKINRIVFDKTGTLTVGAQAAVKFESVPGKAARLSRREKALIYNLARNSLHPLSQQLSRWMGQQELLSVSDFIEEPGKGLRGRVDGHEVQLGSAEFLGLDQAPGGTPSASVAHVAVDGQVRGSFIIANTFRPGLDQLMPELNSMYDVQLLTGDKPAGRGDLLQFFENEKNMFFNQTPFDKLEHIRQFQNQGDKVLMIGDGLNDAGALRSSDVGISIAEDRNTFTPASDAIMESSQLAHLGRFIRMSRISMRIIAVSFAISFIYNMAGLGFAVQGTLSPLIAAILMPLSSITVVLFTSGATTLAAGRLGLLQA